MTDKDTTPSLTIPDDAWIDASDTKDGSVLLSRIEINGVLMHVEAHRTYMLKNCQTGFGQSAFDALHQAFDLDGPLEEILGKRYVLFACAFGK